jgi:high affinity cGMP-specific 3',5'-cyclic phosphodiesterase 9
VISGEMSSPIDVSDSITKGCEDYIIKPLIQNALIKKVETMVENILQKKQLVYEKAMKTSYRSKVKHNREQIKLMSNLINEMKADAQIDSLISDMLNLIKRLKNDQLIEDHDIAAEFETLMSSFAQKNLFKPSFMKLIESQDCDIVTQSQLESIFIPRAGHFKNSIRDRSASKPQKVDHKDVGIEPQFWSLNAWTLSFQEMESLLLSMFESFNLLEQFSISRNSLAQFIHTARTHYSQKNPYHNFEHAFMVTQSTFSLLSYFEFSKVLTNIEIFALLIAAISHDLKHPGVNNAYLIKTKSPLALRYNDVSVLENYHASLCFQILHDPDIKLLESISEEDYIIIRRTIVDAILGTDMEKHFSILSGFTPVVLEELSSRFQEERCDALPIEIRTLIIQLVIKCADISNIASNTSLARFWFNRIAEELFQQGDMEKIQGKTPPAFMDRSVCSVHKLSFDFSNFVGKRLFEILSKINPKTSILLDNIEANLAYLQKAMDLELLDDQEELRKLSQEFKIDFEVHPDHIF